eukprot:361431-Chlamydomonas_euryale.AAC.3
MVGGVDTKKATQSARLMVTKPAALVTHSARMIEFAVPVFTITQSVTCPASTGVGWGAATHSTHIRTCTAAPVPRPLRCT